MLRERLKALLEQAGAPPDDLDKLTEEFATWWDFSEDADGQATVPRAAFVAGYLLGKHGSLEGGYPLRKYHKATALSCGGTEKYAGWFRRLLGGACDARR